MRCWYWLVGLEHVVVRDQRTFIYDQDWLEYSLVEFLFLVLPISEFILFLQGRNKIGYYRMVYRFI